MPVESHNLIATTDPLATRIEPSGRIRHFIIVVDGATAVSPRFNELADSGLPSVSSGDTLELLDVNADFFTLVASSGTSACRVWVVTE